MKYLETRKKEAQRKYAHVCVRCEIRKAVANDNTVCRTCLSVEIRKDSPGVKTLDSLLVDDSYRDEGYASYLRRIERESIDREREWEETEGVRANAIRELEDSR